MQEMVYKSKIRDIENLRQRIIQAWDELDQRVIDSSVHQWRTRLGACVEDEGGHFEYKL
jgi:hypothetical protein